MTADQYIALTASIGGCLSAAATFWTVRQMKKQREDSYRPELLFSRTNFRALPTKVGERHGLPTHWIIDSGGENEAPESQRDIFLPLRNLGLGAAKNVRIVWSFSYEQAIADINRAAERTLTPAHFSAEDGTISVKSAALGNRRSMWKHQQKASFDFVLPASIEEIPIEVSLPSAYILICSALLFFALKDKQESRSMQVPTLTATVEYGDIGDRMHRASFALNLNIYLVAGKGEGEDFRGIIDCAKQN
jgi:hypothetical protein